MDEQIKTFLEHAKTPNEIKIVSDFLSSKSVSFSDPNAKGIIKDLESSLKLRFKTKYAIAMNSGTSAINAAYFSLDLKDGDEILIPSYCFYSSVCPLLSFGIKPIAVPISPETLNYNFDSIDKFITNKTKAILSTSMTGILPNQKEILKISNNYNLVVVEDFSRAYTLVDDIDLIGDVSCFSMQDNKALSAIEGGFLLTNSYEVYEKAIFFSQPGRISNTITSEHLKTYSEGGFGQKYRINPLGALLAIYGLTVIEERIKLCQDNYERFKNLISKFTFLSISESKNIERGAWKDGYARLSLSNQEKVKNFYSQLHNMNLPIFKEYSDNWVPNNPYCSFNPSYVEPSRQIFNSLVVFSGICSYTKDNTSILSKYNDVLKGIRI